MCGLMVSSGPWTGFSDGRTLPPASRGPQFCLRLPLCLMYPTIQLLFDRKVGVLWMRGCSWYCQPECGAQSSPWLLETLHPAAWAGL